MRKIILFLYCLLFAYAVHALPCETTNEDTKKGDSLEDVVNRCGKPYAQSTHTETINTMEKWTYYKPSRLVPNATVTITLVINNGTVLNIEQSNTTLGFNPNTSDVCGPLIQTGNTVQQILNSCGAPNYKETLASTTKQITEMQYSTISPKTWIFEDGILVDWKN